MNEIPLNVTRIEDNINFVFDKIDGKIQIKSEDYVRDKLEKLGIKVEKSDKINGHPDFICEYNGKRFYVEVKGYNDGLRMNQINWILKNKDKLVYVYYLDFENKYTLRLTEVINRKHEDKVYKKYIIFLPPKIIKELGWKKGDKLEPQINDKELIINLKEQ